MYNLSCRSYLGKPAASSHTPYSIMNILGGLWNWTRLLTVENFSLQYCSILWVQKKKKIVSGWTIHLCITACDFTAFFSTLEELSKMLSGTAELPTWSFKSKVSAFILYTNCWQQKIPNHLVCTWADLGSWICIMHYNGGLNFSSLEFHSFHWM